MLPVGWRPDDVDDLEGGRAGITIECSAISSFEEHAHCPSVAERLPPTAARHASRSHTHNLLATGRPLHLGAHLPEDLRELCLRIVLEGDLLVEATVKAVVEIEELLLYVVLVASEDDGQLRAPGLCNIEKLHRHRPPVRVLLRLKCVSLVDEEDPAIRLVDLLGDLIGAHAGELLTRRLDERVAAAHAELLQQAPQKLGHSRLSRAGVAE